MHTLQEVEVLDETFDTPAPDFNPQSAHYHRVLCALERYPKKDLRAELIRRSFNQMVKYNPAILSHVFAALADPTRRRILENLAQGDRCVSELAKPHDISLPAVSKHLRVLEDAGLVSRQRQGRVHTLKLNAKPMKQAQGWIENYRRFWDQRFDRLDAYLNHMQTKKKK